MMNDEFDSRIQSPDFFSEWSKDYYTKAIALAHKYDKKVSIIYNGRLRGTLARICSCGPDAISAVTPFPMGDLTPEECRKEAGSKIILSGGVTPDLWYAYVPMDTFKKACMEWINLSKTSSALIADASNQVPPGAEECRIGIYRELLETYGRY
jgi:uroporphyrinogen-III decarboxylase